MKAFGIIRAIVTKNITIVYSTLKYNIKILGYQRIVFFVCFFAKAATFLFWLFSKILIKLLIE